MIIRVLQRLEEGFIALLLVGMVLVTFTQVVLRYLFGTGISWGIEATYYMFAWMVVFGVSFAVKEGFQLGMDFLVVRLPPFWRRAVGLLVAGFCLLYAAIFFLGGWRLVSRMYDVGMEGVDIPVERWILQSALPIGFALLFVRFCQIGWRIWAGKEPGFPLGDDLASALERRDSQVG